MSLMIKNVQLNQEITDVFIQDKRFTQIGPDLYIEADQTINGSNLAIAPSFANCHTHAAMTLLRGFADDLDLHTWLNQYIWPLEATLTEEDVYIGAKLACLEMIKSGTTFFNDMYWHFPATARAVQEMGIRAAISSVFIDFHNQETANKRWQECLNLYEHSQSYGERVIFALGPHAVYSVSKNSLEKVRDFALEKELIIHMHLSETKQEVEESRKNLGMSPVKYLEQLGLLGPNLCACHCVWLNDRDLELLAENQVNIVHNPTSNLKLCSGFFPYAKIKRSGINMGLGTDGCSSNNNLDMLEETKIASITAKAHHNDPTLMPAPEILKSATENGFKIFNLDCGRIAEGKLADFILIDLNQAQMAPNYNLESNLVYSANGNCVHSTVCNGRVLMQDRKVAGEEKIIEEAQNVAKKLSAGAN